MTDVVEFCAALSLPLTGFCMGRFKEEKVMTITAALALHANNGIGFLSIKHLTEPGFSGLVVPKFPCLQAEAESSSTSNQSDA